MQEDLQLISTDTCTNAEYKTGEQRENLGCGCSFGIGFHIAYNLPCSCGCHLHAQKEQEAQVPQPHTEECRHGGPVG